MLMQTYLNKNSFREKIFRLCVKEETFNVKHRKFILYMIIFGFLRAIQWLKFRVYQSVILILLNTVVV